MQGRETHDALEAQVLSRCAATASATSGMLVIARARQLAFVDLAAAATAALAHPEGKHSSPSHVVLKYPAHCITVQTIRTCIGLPFYRSFRCSHNKADTDLELMALHDGYFGMQQGSPVPDRWWNITCPDLRR